MHGSHLDNRFNFRNPAPTCITEAAYDQLYTDIVIEPTFRAEMLAFGIASAAHATCIFGTSARVRFI